VITVPPPPPSSLTEREQKRQRKDERTKDVNSVNAGSATSMPEDRRAQ
jgi:hypothetical protein